MAKIKLDVFKESTCETCNNWDRGGSENRWMYVNKFKGKCSAGEGICNQWSRDINGGKKSFFVKTLKNDFCDEWVVDDYAMWAWQFSSMKRLMPKYVGDKIVRELKRLGLACDNNEELDMFILCGPTEGRPDKYDSHKLSVSDLSWVSHAMEQIGLEVPKYTFDLTKEFREKNKAIFAKYIAAKKKS